MKAKSSRIAIELLLASALMVVCGGARAEDRREEAQRLFDEARSLLLAGAVADACDKLAASLALDPANGTRLNLAVCREREGKLVEATILFTDVVRQGRGPGQADRVAVAMKHLDAIAPLVPTLEVRVPRAARDTGVQLFIDGEDREAVLRGGVLLTESGRHHLEIVSEDGRRGVADVTLEPGARAIVDLDLPPRLPERSPASAPPPLLPALHRATAGSREPRSAQTESVSSAWPIALGVGLGVGVVATAVGIGFGAHAASLDADADRQCPASLEGRCETAGGAADAAAAADSAIAANVLVGAGLVVVAASVVTFALAPWSQDATEGKRAATPVRPRTRGLAVSF